MLSPVTHDRSCFIEQKKEAQRDQITPGALWRELCYLSGDLGAETQPRWAGASCESSAPNYNSQEAPGAHSPRDVTAAEGASGSASPAGGLLGRSSRTRPWLWPRGKWSYPLRPCREGFAARARRLRPCSGLLERAWTGVGGLGDWHLPYGEDRSPTPLDPTPPL